MIKKRGVIKEELLGSIIEIEDKDEPELEEAVKIARDPKEAIAIIKQYENSLIGQNKKIMNIDSKQEKFLKRFKQLDSFFRSGRLSRPNICFKISLYNFLLKFPVLNWSTLPSSYFKIILR